LILVEALEPTVLTLRQAFSDTVREPHAVQVMY
jgi:hypothetical protein